MAGRVADARHFVLAGLAVALVLIAFAPLLSYAPLDAAAFAVPPPSGWLELPASSPHVRLAIHALVTALLFPTLRSLVPDPGARLAATCFFAFHPLRIEALRWPDAEAVVLGLLATIALWLAAPPARSALRLRLALCGAVVVATAQVSGSGVWLATLLALQAAAAARRTLARVWVGVAGLLLVVGGWSDGLRKATPESLARFVVGLVNDLSVVAVPVGWAPFAPPPELTWWAPLAAVGCVLAGAALIHLRNTHAALLVGAVGYSIASLGTWESGWTARGTYVPHIVLSFAVAWALARISAGRGTLHRTCLNGVVIVIAVVAMRLELGLWADSHDVLTRAVRVHSESADAHVAFARAQAEQGDWAGAIATYREALRLDPQHALAHMHLGTLYAGRGFPQHAEYHLRAAVRISPHHAPSHARFASLLFEHGQHEAALPLLHRAVELDPSDWASRLRLAQLLHRRGERTAALDHAWEVLRLAPSARLAHAMIAEELAGSGRLEEAREHWHTAIELAADDVDAWTRLGNIEARLGNLEAARAAYGSALAIDPSHADARRHLDLVDSLVVDGS